MKRLDYTAQGLVLVKQLKGNQDDFWYRLDADLTNSAGQNKDFMVCYNALLLGVSWMNVVLGNLKQKFQSIFNIS